MMAKTFNIFIIKPSFDRDFIDVGKRRDLERNLFFQIGCEDCERIDLVLETHNVSICTKRLRELYKKHPEPSDWIRVFNRYLQKIEANTLADWVEEKPMRCEFGHAPPRKQFNRYVKKGYLQESDWSRFYNTKYDYRLARVPSVLEGAE